MKKINTYLIHGSLGSGKTTFLKQLLQSELFKDSIVIENEFANVNVDKALLSDCENKILDVSGGCICCTSGTEFFDSLEQVTKEKNITTLFIETTGVASSVSLIKQMMLSASFDDNFQLVKNIFIIDALENDPKLLKKEKLLDVLMADLIVLNKVDVASHEKLSEFTRFFDELKITYVETSHGDLSAESIRSDKSSKSLEVLQEHISEILSGSNEHTKDILYQVIYPTKTISNKELEKIFRNNKNIYRIKGTFVDEKGDLVSVNATPNNFEFASTQSNEKAALVLIGKDLTKSAIKPLVTKLC